MGHESVGDTGGEFDGSIVDSPEPESRTGMRERSGIEEGL
jgi:hypothetical protein